MDILAPILLGLFPLGIVFAIILSVELRPILTRLDKVIHLLEKK